MQAPATASPSTDIVALGEAMIEFNEARASGAHAWLQGFGGDTSNMAIAAARLGARSGYATRLGNDAFGRRLIELWKREGVAVDGVAVDADAPTGVYFVSHDESGHTFSYLRAGSAASRMTPATLPLAAIRATRVLHLSAISQAISATACDACFAAIDAARAAGARVSYDTNLRLALWPLARARAVVRETLRLADWALPGLDDARHLFDTEEPTHTVGARRQRRECFRGCRDARQADHSVPLRLAHDSDVRMRHHDQASAGFAHARNVGSVDDGPCTDQASRSVCGGKRPNRRERIGRIERHFEHAKSLGRQRIRNCRNLGRRDAAQHRDERQRREIVVERQVVHASTAVVTMPACTAMRHRPCAAASAIPRAATMPASASARS